MNTDNKSKEPVDSLFQNKIRQIDLKKYSNKKVGFFLKDLKVPYLKYHFMDEPVCLLSFVRFIYGNNIHVEIYISEYKYLNKLNKKRKWSIDKFKKEKISKIIVKIDREVVNQFSK